MNEVTKISPDYSRPDYSRLEKNSIDALNELIEAPTPTKGMLLKAKLAQGALASVQSHQKSDMTRRHLDFAMARSLTTDPAKLAEYIRLTQHGSAIVTALGQTPPVRIANPDKDH